MHLQRRRPGRGAGASFARPLSRRSCTRQHAVAPSQSCTAPQVVLMPCPASTDALAVPAVPAAQHITKLGTLRLDDPNNLHVEEVRSCLVCCAPRSL